MSVGNVVYVVQVAVANPRDSGNPSFLDYGEAPTLDEARSIGRQIKLSGVRILRVEVVEERAAP